MPVHERRLAHVRLPPLERAHERALSLIGDCADLVAAHEGEDGVQFRVTERLPFDSGGRNRRLDELRLADPSESLPQQRLDGLDPGAVIGNGDLLPETLAALRAGAGRPTSPGWCWSRPRAGRGGSSRPPRPRVRASAGPHSRGRARRTGRELERLRLGDHRQALSGVPSLRVVAVDDGFRPSSSANCCSGGRTVRRRRDGAARAAISELRAAERGGTLMP